MGFPPNSELAVIFSLLRFGAIDSILSPNLFSLLGFSSAHQLSPVYFTTSICSLPDAKKSFCGLAVTKHTNKILQTSYDPIFLRNYLLHSPFLDGCIFVKYILSCCLYFLPTHNTHLTICNLASISCMLY